MEREQLSEINFDYEVPKRKKKEFDEKQLYRRMLKWIRENPTEEGRRMREQVERIREQKRVTETQENIMKNNFFESKEGVSDRDESSEDIKNNRGKT